MSLCIRINILEQKAIENFIEIVGVPEPKDEDCVKTVKKLLQN